MRSLWASELNNQGMEDQLRYLHKQGWIGELKDQLIEAGKNAHSTLFLRKNL
jgi:hypothetical protein